MTETVIVDENPWSETPITHSPILDGVHCTVWSTLAKVPVGVVQFARGMSIWPLFPKISVLIADRFTLEPALTSRESISISKPVAWAGKTRILPKPTTPILVLTDTFQ